MVTTVLEVKLHIYIYSVFKLVVIIIHTFDNKCQNQNVFA